jgi:alpha-beta hydrolase superfamily lysophospholipase
MSKKHILIKWAKRGGRWLLIGGAGVLITVVVGAVVYLNSQPSLSVWHEVHLDEEFTANSDVSTLKEYLELEDRLFQQLDDQVYAKVPAGKHSDISRYTRGSKSDPNGWARNWNRTFELSNESAKVGVLLLHGMSDSPYSLHQLGEILHARGARVLGLRMPGHGTAPSGLVRATWEDMAAATKLGVKHLHSVMGDKPVYIVGYSNGGGHAVNYVLDAAADRQLPMPTGVVLICPEIGVTPAASLAIWQARLGRLLGLEKLAWTSVIPEYDPYKYSSFAVNAGVQAYRLTQEIQTKLDALEKEGTLDRVPPILAFQSALDATVSIDALVAGLFDRLPQGGHELTIFDLNRTTDVIHFLKDDPKAKLAEMLSKPDRTFTLTWITNANPTSLQVIERRREPGTIVAVDTPLGLSWPENVYSLSHLALPFSPEDPLYGGHPKADQDHIQLGAIEFRGERGAMLVSVSTLLRQHWNPFYSYLERRTIDFMGLGKSAPTPSANKTLPQAITR